MLQVENLIIRNYSGEFLSVPSFYLRAGCKGLVIGNNQTGKTLFLKTLHGIYEDYEGEVLIRNAKISKKTKYSIFISAGQNIFFEKTVWDNLTLTLPKNLPAWQEKKIQDLSNLTGLAPYYEHPVYALSYSMQKFVEIVRAVVQNPYLILIDDLDSYFDVVQSIKINALLDSALASGVSVLATAKIKLPDYDWLWAIQNGIMVER